LVQIFEDYIARHDSGADGELLLPFDFDAGRFWYLATVEVAD